MLTIITASIGRDTIHDAYESLKAQTDPNWEWIICGDGVRPPSFWDPEGRVRSYKFPHLRHEAHMRNIGVEIANTEWVSFLDDDDWLAPDYVETINRSMSESVDVIYLTQVGISGKHFPTKPGVEWGEVGISYALRRKWAQSFPYMPVLHEDFEQVKELEVRGAVFQWCLDKPRYFARNQRPEEVMA